MKKYLVVLLSVMMVFGAFTFASADDAGMDSVRAAEPGAKVIFGGDAVIRGFWLKDYDLNGDVDQDNRFMDERIRLKMDAHVGDGIEARSRIILLGDGSGDEVVLDGDTTTRDQYTVDYAYLHIPVASLAIDAGLYKRSFGNTLYMIDNRVTTVQVSGDLGNVAVSAFLDKEDDTEDSIIGDDNLKDHDNWGLTAVTTVNNVELGAMIYMEKDARPAVDESGTEIDIYANANINNIAIAAELARTSGDIPGNEDTADNARMGAFVSATMPVNDINVSGAIAYAKDGFTADSHFTPTLFIGTDQTTAAIDFGATDEETSYAVAVTAGYDVSEDLSVYGRLAYLSQDKMGVSAKDRTATEFDAGLAYSLGKNATYTIDFGYLSPDDWTTQDDAAMALAHAVELVF